MIASPNMNKYFDMIDKNVKLAFTIAQRARKQGYDPFFDVEVRLAKNLAERVVGLISVVAPQIVESSIVERILELEKKYSSLDWRVALCVALEVAQEKFCKFTDQREAMEAGIRVGFAYATLGVVSSPLEGFTSLELKDRLDGGGKYFCMNYAGPIRNAGGTMAALSVIIGDYIRVHMGFAPYDPTEKEVLRCFAEISDYHEYITNLQYFPTEQESTFLMQNIPIEISGDPSEKYEVSNANLRDLPRVSANKLRSGYCLIHSSCIPLKAPKLWKNLLSWGAEMGLDHWNFLGDFVKLQKKMKAKGKSSSNSKDISPDYTYIKDLVAGRPVFGHPLKSGGFRLRYGRSRTSGYSAMSIHPATSGVLDDFLASATHVKVERPSKGAALTMCDTIDGPIVLLNDGTVCRLNSYEESVKVRDSVKEILYVGDLLVSYGDFLDRAHQLVPPGYCPEFWSLEVEEVRQEGVLSPERLSHILKNPLRVTPTYEEAKILSLKWGVPLHPAFVYYYSQITLDQLKTMVEYFSLHKDGFAPNLIVLPHSDGVKRCLELCGIPHKGGEHITIEGEVAHSLYDTFGAGDFSKVVAALTSNEEVMAVLNSVAPFRLRDKAGIFIGARMGRPEKAKMRKLTGSPHGLFPVGGEGGRLRSIQSALEAGKVTADFCLFYCPKCDEETVYARCHRCDAPAVRQAFSSQQGKVPFDERDSTQVLSQRKAILVEEYVHGALKKLKTKIMPDLIKGVRGTSNKEHLPEHLVKAVLRAKHEVFVNKDGTTRYDASEVTLTHFKPVEIGVSVNRLKDLGYVHDIFGKPLQTEDQILELFCQDVVLPASSESPDEGADNVLLRTAQFIDELLEKLYHQPPFYHIRSRNDLVGHFVVALAPHTSAGMVGRIIGFSQTQGFFAHPYFHAALRRDCDGDEACFFLILDAFLNFSRKYLPDSRGSTMDAPLVLTTKLDPAEVDDMAFHVDVPWRYPLSFYKGALEQKMPWEVAVELVENRLGKPEQYEGFGFTHDTTNFNDGAHCSAYKSLPSMEDKLKAQMVLAERLRGVVTKNVAELVINKHFIRDTKGNLRKFSLQQFRCVHCNEKFRRPPLQGRCTSCNGKVIFTISEGSVIKYLEPSLSLAYKYDVSPYIIQTLELTKRRIESYFGKEKEKQMGLGAWFEK